MLWFHSTPAAAYATCRRLQSPLHEMLTSPYQSSLDTLTSVCLSTVGFFIGILITTRYYFIHTQSSSRFRSTALVLPLYDQGSCESMRTGTLDLAPFTHKLMLMQEMAVWQESFKAAVWV